MPLSDSNIKKAMKKGEIKITPFEPSQLGGATVDLTLSDEWYFFKKKFHNKIVDLKETDFNEALELKKAKIITLKPGEMCLGKTIEKITLSPSIMGKLEGRTRYARMGLCIHVTAALVQPGSDNRQVLEIVNFAPFSIKLHAGMRITQILFEKMDSPTTKPYAKFGKAAKVQ
ncbi:MAG: dCTP deaminase [Candidatus Micrarchaeota archaeon]